MTKIRSAGTVLLAVLMAIAFMPAAAFAETVPAGTAITDGMVITSPGSYYLDKDVTGPITVNLNAKETEGVTINLNGHNITNDSGDAVINKTALTNQDPYGLMITGTGNITASRAAVAGIPDSKTLLKGGTYNSSGWYTIKNLGTLNIQDNVTVKESPENKYPLIDNGWNQPTVTKEDEHDNDTIGGTTYYRGSGKTNMEIAGGVFSVNPDSKTNQSVLNDYFGTMTVDGGVFNGGSSSYAIKNKSTLTINDGSFTGTTAITCSIDNGRVHGLYVNDGEFTSTEGSTCIEVNIEREGSTTDLTAYQILGGIFNKFDDGMQQIIILEKQLRTNFLQVPLATIVNVNTGATTYAVGETPIRKAAAYSGNSVTITGGTVGLNDVSATIVNENGDVSVDDKNLEQGETYYSKTKSSIAELQNTVQDLTAQIAQAQSAGGSSAAQISSLQTQLTQAQAELKAAQESNAQFDAVTAQVGGVKAKAGKRKATLTWTPQTSGISGYQIYRRAAGGKYKLVKRITDIAAGKWTNRNLKKGKKYYYRIRAYRSITGGELWGAYSAAVKVKVK